MTETTMTAGAAKTVKTATVASLCLLLYDKQKEGKVLSRTATIVMKAAPLKLNPPFCDPETLCKKNYGNPESINSV